MEHIKLFMGFLNEEARITTGSYIIGSISVDITTQSELFKAIERTLSKKYKLKKIVQKKLLQKLFGKRN